MLDWTTYEYTIDTDAQTAPGVGDVSCAGGYELSDAACTLTAGVNCSVANSGCSYTAPVAATAAVAESCAHSCQLTAGVDCSKSAGADNVTGTADDEDLPGCSYTAPVTAVAATNSTCSNAGTALPEAACTGVGLAEDQSACEGEGCTFTAGTVEVAAVAEACVADATYCQLTAGTDCSVNTSCIYTAPVVAVVGVAEACALIGASASCETTGDQMSYSGCAELSCAAPGSDPAGYTVENPTGTTVSGLGKVSCAPGYNWLPCVLTDAAPTTATNWRVANGGLWQRTHM